MAEFTLNDVVLDIPDAMLNDKLLAKFSSGGYEAHEAHAAKMRVKPGNRVLELGAGVGYIASICAGATGPENVITVEANPDMLPVIRANLDRNGFQATSLLHGAVTGEGNDGQTIEFEQKKTFWAGRLAHVDSNPEALVEVPVLLFSELLKQHRPHVVIMDIEGAEAHLFGASWPRHVRQVILELHPRQYPDALIKEMIDCMSNSGLTYDPVASRGRVLGFRRVRGM